MPVPYDSFYQTQNLFGEPYPELLDFFKSNPIKGMVLDLGCGQGRNAIAIARLGYSVKGIDNSKVGIDQINQVLKSERLDLKVQVGDIYQFNDFDRYDVILLDSMLHFAKNDKEKESALVQRVISMAKDGAIIVICIQDKANKIRILKDLLESELKISHLNEKQFNYTFTDEESGHKSDTEYRMMIIEK